MRNRVRSVACAAAVAALVSIVGCGKKSDNAPGVATPSLSLSKDRVPIGSVVKLTYRFQVEPNAHFDKSYWVFVHMLDTEGEQMWTDDHEPPTPTTAWQPGQTIEYTRTVFIPNYPYIGEATARLGLYDRATGERLPLKGQEVSRREYVVAKFQVLPSSENVVLLNKDGWHQAEVDSKNPGTEWQWTQKSATIEFRNPKKDAVLYLDYDARVDQFNPPQQVTLSIGKETVGQFAADARNPTLKTFPISAAQLGSGDTVTLDISVDRTFKPGAGDPRELGIRVYHTYLDVK
ncbi:MAG TPA: hypothetical protein VNR64_09595 [Vicinamibacterales bacterium]|nr:hypothetical protein [Vicinamibacterales bacterium]